MLWPAPEANGPSPSANNALLRELREELHALAQPLMLLQARREADALTGGCSTGRDALLASLTIDAERACRSFRAVQYLVARLGRDELLPSMPEVAS